MENTVEISLEFAQDLGMVPYPEQRSIRWAWENPNKHRAFNLASRQKIIDEYCSNKELLLCTLPESSVLEAVRKKQQGTDA